MATTGLRAIVWLAFAAALSVGCSLGGGGGDAQEFEGRRYIESQWADRVVEFSTGSSEGIAEQFSDTTDALGLPDWDEATSTGAVSLGNSDATCAAQLILEFVDNKVFNGSGPDLKIVEVGSTNESVSVSLRIDGGHEWVEVGVVDGFVSEIDLVGLDPGIFYSQVRLCPVVGASPGGSRSAESAGPDIDAVAAINSCQQCEGG